MTVVNQWERQICPRFTNQKLYQWSQAFQLFAPNLYSLSHICTRANWFTSTSP